MPEPLIRTRLSAATVRELLRYDQRTGDLTWRVNRSRTAKAGDDAGTLRKDGTIVVTIRNQQHLANRIVWLYVTGSWPPGRLTTYDKDPANLRWANILPAIEIASQTPSAAYQRQRRRFLAAQKYRDHDALSKAMAYHDPNDPRDPRNPDIYVKDARRGKQPFRSRNRMNTIPPNDN